MAKKIEYVKVDSSNIKEVAHSSQQSSDKTPLAEDALRLRFHNGDEYEYSPVSEELYNNMMDAPSIGKWFWANLRENSGINVTEI